MRGEVDDDVLAGGLGDLLLDLRRMAVLADRVGRQALAGLGEEEVLLEAAAGAGDAGLGVDDDVADVDLAARRERQQREQRRGRVAAGAGDEPRVADGGAVVLGEPVDRLGLKVHRLVLVAVPGLVGLGVAEPEVGRHVDELDLRVLRKHRPGDLLRGAVGQAAEDGVDAAPVGVLDGGEARQLDEAEMREDLGHGLAGMGVGGERRDLHLRMEEGEADEVGARVAGGAQHADPDLVVHGIVAPRPYTGARYRILMSVFQCEAGKGQVRPCRS